MKFTLVVCALLFALTLATALPVIQTKNQKIFVDGTEFLVKGVAYSPTPLGKTAPGGQGGFCSPRKNEIGQYISPCIFEDYFDGSNVTQAQLNGITPPTKPWFKPLWERDIPLMKDLGVNTVRFYHTNPVTLAAVASSNGKYQYGTEHRTFLDMCHANGLMVIFPLHGEHGPLINEGQSQYEELLRYQIDEVGNHPAILMYALGNELPVYGGADDKGDLVVKLNHYMDYIRQYQQQKWNRTIPLTNCVVDLPHSYNTLVQTLKVDVFCTNAGYRGYDFSDLFTPGSAATNFSGMWSLGCANKKPIMIGEIGWHSLNNSITKEAPEWFNRILQSLIANMEYGAIGGIYFEYADEPHKADPLQKQMGLVTYNPNVQPNNQSSLNINNWLADTVERKPIYWLARNGTYNNIPYNFQADWFALMNRAPYTLTTVPDICTKAPTPNPSWCTWSLCSSVSGNPSTGDGSETSQTDTTVMPTTATSDSSLVDTTSSTTPPPTTSSSSSAAQTTVTSATTAQTTTSSADTDSDDTSTTTSSTSSSTNAIVTTASTVSATTNSASTNPASTTGTSGASVIFPTIFSLLALFLFTL